MPRVKVEIRDTIHHKHVKVDSPDDDNIRADSRRVTKDASIVRRAVGEVGLELQEAVD